MSQEKGYLSSDNKRKVTTHRLLEMKQRGEKISMLTAYDYSMASVIDQAGMDVILVGDSASNVMAGNTTTLPMTVEQMIYHGKSVMNGVKRAMVVIDMPFGSYLGQSLRSGDQCGENDEGNTGRLSQAGRRKRNIAIHPGNTECRHSHHGASWPHAAIN